MPSSALKNRVERHQGGGLEGDANRVSHVGGGVERGAFLLELHLHDLLGVVPLFFNDAATTEIYTLSLHDALPISGPPAPASIRCCSTSRRRGGAGGARSEEHTSELQSPYVISYAVFCLQKKNSQPIPWGALGRRSAGRVRWALQSRRPHPEASCMASSAAASCAPPPEWIFFFLKDPGPPGPHPLPPPPASPI